MAIPWWATLLTDANWPITRNQLRFDLLGQILGVFNHHIIWESHRKAISRWFWQENGYRNQSPLSLCNWKSTFRTQSHETSWWFQPIWKICSSNWTSSPNRGEHKKYLKPSKSWRSGSDDFPFQNRLIFRLNPPLIFPGKLGISGPCFVGFHTVKVPRRGALCTSNKARIDVMGWVTCLGEAFLILGFVVFHIKNALWLTFCF